MSSHTTGLQEVEELHNPVLECVSGEEFAAEEAAAAFVVSF